MESTRVEEGLQLQPEGLQPEGLQPEPMFRYHCQGCSKVTLASRGQATVTCGKCGAEVGDASQALDEIRDGLARHQELGLWAMESQALVQARQGFEDYARVDNEVTVHMVKMSEEFTLATLYQVASERIR